MTGYAAPERKPNWRPLMAGEEAQLLVESRRISGSSGDHYGDLV